MANHVQERKLNILNPIKYICYAMQQIIASEENDDVELEIEVKKIVKEQDNTHIKDLEKGTQNNAKTNKKSSKYKVEKNKLNKANKMPVRKNENIIDKERE